MMSYWQLLMLILPVFGLIGIGVVLRRVGWMTTEADASLLKMVVNWLYPCLIFESVLNNAALRVPANLGFAPAVGFGAMVFTILGALYAGRLLGLTQGHGLRTFAFASGINNYGYVPIPLMAALFGTDSLGMLMVHNVGCEAAIWTVGILVLSGLSLREGWKKLFNAPVIALVLGLVGNLSRVGPHVPEVVNSVIHQCAICSIPLGLILIGGTLDPYFERPRELFEPRVSVFSSLLRLGAFPLVYVVLAKYLPCSIELKRVLVVQGAMPAGILPIVIAKHYGGQPLVAVRVVIGTTALGIFLIPLWLRFGLAWVL
ncbi:transporter [Opitutaceae bacterium EW11]|nr:transporter [Opitutaceae bacterium EW11]